MKKIISICCAVAMLLSLFFVSGISFASAATDGDFEYEITDGEVTIIGYTGNPTNVMIPSTIEGYPVTTIGDEAFYWCDSLVSVTIPDSVTTIGAYAFYYCRSLVSVTIGDAVTTIRDGAFSDCYSLESVTIPDAVTTIGDWAFTNCDSLVSVTIPDAVAMIGESAFSYCDSLENVTIGDAVTTIGDYAFYNCDSLEKIDVSEDNISYCDIDGVLFSKDKTVLVCYPASKSQTTYTIPDLVTTIGDYAFYDCSFLVSMTIPDAVTTIGDWAFSNCDSLVSVTIGDAVTTIGNYAFSGCYSLVSVTIPDSVTTIGDWAFPGCNSLEQMEVSEDNIAYCAIDGVLFSEDKTVLVCYPAGKLQTTYTIPDLVTTIGDCAFYDCDSLESVTIGDAVTTIGEYAFYDCTSLESVTIPDSVTTIGGFAFSSCDSLESVTIGDAVTTIGYWAFSDCDALESVTIPDSVTTIGDSAFSYCTSLESVTIPDSVTTIGYWAFSDCDALADVYYAGTQKQWGDVDIGYYNDLLTSAYIHYHVNASEVADHCQLVELLEEPTCVQSGCEIYTCDCGYEMERVMPALGHTPSMVIETVLPTCTSDGHIVYGCAICGEEYEDDYTDALGHTFEDGVCTNCQCLEEDLVESSHDYENNCDQIWTIVKPGAVSVTVTFSPKTYVDYGYDYIYIYDGEDNEIGRYTGDQLASQSLTVSGDTFKIRLTSDGSDTYYGFAVTDVQVEYGEITPPAVGDIDGDGAFDAQDAATVFFFVNAVGTLTEEQLLAADVNEDGVVNLFDAARLFYMVNGLI